jgi:hypothetical protein
MDRGIVEERFVVKRKISTVLASTAILAACIYLILASIAFFYFPKTYSPLTNWLSDLGNPNLNPSGAFYYNSGGILASAFLFFFFAGIYTWRSGDRKMNAFLFAAVVTGIALAFALGMTAYFPLGVNDSLHSTFSIMLFIFVGFFEIFSSSAIRKNPFYPKILSVFGFVVTIINFAFAVSFNFTDLFVGEWVMIGLFIAYTLALSTVTIRSGLKPKPRTTS